MRFFCPVCRTSLLIYILQDIRARVLHSLLVMEDKKAPKLQIKQPGQSRYDMFYSFTNEIARAARAWSRDYLPRCYPLIMCALVGPASVHILGDQEPCPDKRRRLASESLRLVLRCVARYWNIGKVLLGKYWLTLLERNGFLTTAPLDILEAQGKFGSLIEESHLQHAKEKFLPQWRGLVEDSN
jgi:hypothetical protein